ncbi:hypothetical protein [Pedobacter sp.]|uniref:hypothetical protein n=1 Tax=Pedobacter sp. TaxID=1411316 RepID=UPI0031DEAC3E
MNRVILVIVSLLISASAFAQIDGNYNYSIGIKGYNIVQMPKILQQTNTDDYTTMWLNSGMIKINDNQMAFRISGHYYYKRDLTFDNQCETCETAKGNFSDFSIKVGFEKNFNYSVIQPYFGFDIGFRASHFKGDIENKNSSNLKVSYAANSNKNGATFSPVLGVKVNALKNLSFFAESTMDFFYAYERQETVLNDANNTRTFAKYNKLETLLNPVSIGIQFHLVGKN